MKHFFSSFLASLLAMLVAGFIMLFIVFALIIGSFMKFSEVGSEKPIVVLPNTVLHITLDKGIPERSSKNLFENFKFGMNNFQLGLNDILGNIKKAAADEKIAGIYLDISDVSAGFATVEEIRNALVEFKKSGKFIIAYSETYSQKAYYLATAADKILLNPQGEIQFKGLSAQIMFFKGLLEKLEVNMQIFRHGKFKSAIEPLLLDKMSQANREQLMGFINSIWNHLLQGVSETRNISTEELNRIANNMLVQNAGDCIRFKLADDTLYKDSVLDLLRDKMKLKKNAAINTVEFARYTRTPNPIYSSAKDKIAVVYASGGIVSGEGDDHTIGSEKISKTIREARLDSSIKAIVLRVNSPGGSALASDVIWREVLLARKEKPIIVSMGDVAASGGYYISCAADAIVAQPNTLTGSIGVFGVLPNAQKFYKNKLGITFDTANTNKHADIGSAARPLSAEEGAVIQREVENIYTAFVSKVGSGRKMTTAGVDSIAQGRVWSGADGKRIGLVDTLGGIDAALALAAKKANIKSYKIVSLPKQKEPLEEFLEDVMGEASVRFIKQELGASYAYYEYLDNLMRLKGIQARMPYDLIVY